MHLPSKKKLKSETHTACTENIIYSNSSFSANYRQKETTSEIYSKLGDHIRMDMIEMGYSSADWMLEWGQDFRMTGY